MGYAGKPVEGGGGGGEGVESEVKKWMIAGIALRSPLKPIFTTKAAPQKQEEESEEKSLSTPTSEESRIPPCKFQCPPPPPPRKKPKSKSKSKSSSSCGNVSGGGAIRDDRLFTSIPLDFELLFTRRYSL